MKHRNRLSNQQRKFLQDLRAEPATLEQILARLGIRRWTMSRWHGNAVFRDALAEAVKEVRSIGDLELELNFRVALRILKGMAEGTITVGHLRRAAAAEVCTLRVHRPKWSEPKPEKVPPEEKAPSPHPSHGPERGAELVEQLRQMQLRRVKAHPPDAGLGA